MFSFDMALIILSKLKRREKMRTILAIVTSATLAVIPTTTLAAAGPLMQACAPGTPYAVCLCTANPSRCYPGTFVLRPR
jgi:hypothetical protein